MNQPAIPGFTPAQASLLAHADLLMGEGVGVHIPKTVVYGAMAFGFADLVAHAAYSRDLVPGTIIGSGTVSNRDADGSPGRPCSAGGRGYSCIAEQRMVETIATGQAETPFLRYGDVVRIDMKDARGHSIFGAIEGEVVAL